jgi:hypothetical protein
MIMAISLEVLLKVHGMREARGKTLTDEMAEHVIQELRPKHPVLAAVVL